MNYFGETYTKKIYYADFDKLIIPQNSYNEYFSNLEINKYKQININNTNNDHFHISINLGNGFSDYNGVIPHGSEHNIQYNLKNNNISNTSNYIIGAKNSDVSIINGDNSNNACYNLYNVCNHILYYNESQININNNKNLLNIIQLLSSQPIMPILDSVCDIPVYSYFDIQNKLNVQFRKHKLMF